MRQKHFNEITKHLLDKAQDTLTKKSVEYSENDDKLSNFKQPCSIMGTNPSRVCLFYDMKHISSLAKIAKDLDDGIFPTEELLREKVQDYINYGILFYATVVEQMEKEGILIES